MKKHLIGLVVWGLLFGYMEAAIVVYLRQIYYPDGFLFPVVVMDGHIMLTELLREAATLILIWATAALTYQRMQSRIAAFFLLFGVWDIFYYIFLKLLLDWPEGLGTWDILFLIPLPWVGPVWAPVVVSIAFIFSSTFILTLNHMDRYPAFDRRFLLLELLAAAIIILSFILPGSAVIEQSMPTDFPLFLFLGGLMLGIGVFVYYIYAYRKR
jgi:hypothetical protein